MCRGIHKVIIQVKSGLAKIAPRKKALSGFATTAAIYSHAIRGKDRAAAQVWDDLMQQSRAEKPAGVN